VWLLARYYLHLSPSGMHLPVKITMAFAFRINLFLNTINAIFFLLQQVRDSQLEAERFRKISAQAQFQSLKDQVNPHFLFNSLNVLSSLVHKDAEASTEFIDQLARVYRYLLKQYDKELVEVGSEMEFIYSYVYLLEKRFGNSLRVQMEVPEEYLSLYIVPVALQMLFENAIKHNVSSRSRPLVITVTVDSSPAITVINNLQPKLEKDPSTQIGLDNISRRYEFVTKRSVAVIQDENYFRVTLPLIRLFDDEHTDNRGRDTGSRTVDPITPEIQ
jgi:LytS/YehU family sensor histidine kinase